MTSTNRLAAIDSNISIYSPATLNIINKQSSFNNFITEKKQDCSSRTNLSRTAALERAYVHDVYSAIAISNINADCSSGQSFVKKFILNFEPGSILLDIGCGDGKYLNVSSDLVVVGLEHCAEWFKNENYRRENNYKPVLLGDIHYLPFQDDFFDGVLCCSVLHHISTLEKRIKALKEITRIMKIGSRLLLTVTSVSENFKDFESQDVLIKVNCQKKLFSNLNESDNDSHSFTSSASTSTWYSNHENPPCKTYHNPSSFEFETCYSFMKKAFKRFSLTSSGYSFKNSFSDASSRSKFSNLDIPVELRNLEDSTSDCSKSSSTTGDSALSSFNRSSGCISQASSNTVFSSSIFTVIKDKLLSWKIHLSNSIEQWQSCEINEKFSTEKKELLHKNLDNNNHRLSLPIGFWGKPDLASSNTSKNILVKNKVYASNAFDKNEVLAFLSCSKVQNSDAHLKKTFHMKHQNPTESMLCLLKNKSRFRSKKNCVLKNQRINRKSKSMSSLLDFKKQRNSDFITYHSMKDLRIRYACSHLNTIKLLKSIELVRIENLNISSNSQSDQKEKNILNFISNYDENEIAKEEKIGEVQTTNSYDSLKKTSSISHDSENKTEEIEEMQENISALKQKKPKNLEKKLLRQRSFSADYQPEIVKLQPDQPRRFSASPNIGTHRYNNINHTPHHQQISMESEESFVTIIPAYRSTRESFTETVNFNDLTDFDSEEYEFASDQEFSSNEIYSYSSEDDACCENLYENQHTSNDTSISSVLEATIKSVSNESSSLMASDEDIQNFFDEEINQPNNSNNSPLSPPATLHRYYHLFQSGELEQIIEEHVQNLHVIESFYNEYAMSWCVVAEKIHVWTI